jgi:hypothetical protein
MFETAIFLFKTLESNLKASGRNLSSSHQRYESAEKDLLYLRQKMREVKEKEAETRAKWNKKRESKEVRILLFD